MKRLDQCTSFQKTNTLSLWGFFEFPFIFMSIRILKCKGNWPIQVGMPSRGFYKLNQILKLIKLAVWGERKFLILKVHILLKISLYENLNNSMGSI